MGVRGRERSDALHCTKMEQAQSILTTLLPSLVELRHLIHSKPDLSLQEHDTAARVTEYISAHLNKSTVKWDVRSGIGGAGVVITINSYVPSSMYTPQCTHAARSGVEGETLLFRSELDALPIDEPNDIPYRSTRPNISHKCGHDGHMAILCGLGAVLAQNPPAKGTEPDECRCLVPFTDFRSKLDAL